MTRSLLSNRGSFWLGLSSIVPDLRKVVIPSPVIDLQLIPDTEKIFMHITGDSYEVSGFCLSSDQEALPPVSDYWSEQIQLTQHGMISIPDRFFDPDVTPTGFKEGETLHFFTSFSLARRSPTAPVVVVLRDRIARRQLEVLGKKWPEGTDPSMPEAVAQGKVVEVRPGRVLSSDEAWRRIIQWHGMREES